MTASLCQSGSFCVGCNYWASHAGLRMWSDWRADIVDADLAQLAGLGHQILRIFPLWPDFQPLDRMHSYQGNSQELRVHEQPLGSSTWAQAGIDPVMMERFCTVCQLAEKHGLQLIVGLVTGWMSGRLFVPRAFEACNVITDPEAIQWQVRFVSAFVETFRNSPAIVAWDLGNECNCMGAAPSAASAWCWTNAIAGAIRRNDTSRPIVSGMHSLSPRGTWRMQDQGELTDVLTTHPYPAFTPFCNQDPICEIRNTLHATAESRYYADLGGKPCFAEELGTLGPMNGSETVAAAYLRTALWSLYANDCRALLWWCAYDQDHLDFAPYDWTGWERELGLLRSDRTPKPVAEELAAFARMARTLPNLPQRQAEAVCILTNNQDSWAAAFSAFILAKQAGFDLRFQYVDQPLQDSDLYLVPSLCGDSGMPRRTWLSLMDRVRDGATLYVSHQDAIFQPFRTLFGADVISRQTCPDGATIAIESAGGAWSCRAKSGSRLNLSAHEAIVLGRHEDGAPAFLRNTVGRGTVFLLNGALEDTMSRTPNAFVHPATSDAWRLYALVAERHCAGRAIRKDNPFLGVTEHPVSDNERLIVAINYASRPCASAWHVAREWRLENVLAGPAPEGGMLRLDGNSAAVLRLVRE